MLPGPSARDSEQFAGGGSVSQSMNPPSFPCLYHTPCWPCFSSLNHRSMKKELCAQYPHTRDQWDRHNLCRKPIGSSAAIRGTAPRDDGTPKPRLCVAVAHRSQPHTWQSNDPTGSSCSVERQEKKATCARAGSRHTRRVNMSRYCSAWRSVRRSARTVYEASLRHEGVC